MDFGGKVIIIFGIAICVFASISVLTYIMTIPINPPVNGSTTTKQFAGTYIPGELIGTSLIDGSTSCFFYSGKNGSYTITDVIYGRGDFPIYIYNGMEIYLGKERYTVISVTSEQLVLG